MPDPDLANSITFMFTTIGSEIEPWGANWVRRDRQLREFINIEPFLKATIFNIAVSRAALPWEIDGPPRTARRVQEALLGSDWIPTIMKTAFDVLTQDNAGFIEIVVSPPKNRHLRLKLGHGWISINRRYCIPTQESPPAIETDFLACPRGFLLRIPTQESPPGGF